MKVKQLAASLKVMENIYDDAGAIEKKEALAAFAELLKGHESKTVAAFTKLLQKQKHLTASSEKKR